MYHTKGTLQKWFLIRLGALTFLGIKPFNGMSLKTRELFLQMFLK